jgi:hypothetical protein
LAHNEPTGIHARFKESFGPQLEQGGQGSASPKTRNWLGKKVRESCVIVYLLRSSFLPFESVVGTLLHELVHNEIGPHNTQFKRKLNQVTEQCQRLILDSMRIASIFDCGHVLGGDDAAIQVHSQRELVRLAAETRFALISSLKTRECEEQRTNQEVFDLDVIELD